MQVSEADRLASQGFMNSQNDDVLSLGGYKINQMYGTQDEIAQTVAQTASDKKKNRSSIRVHSTKGHREMVIKHVDNKFTTGANFYNKKAKRTNYLDEAQTMSMMSSVIPN